MTNMHKKHNIPIKSVQKRVVSKTNVNALNAVGLIEF